MSSPLLQEYIRGHVTIENKYELKHDGLLISLKGLIDLNFNYKNVDFMNTFQGTNKTYTILDRYREILPPGKLLPGLKKIPFEIPLDPDDKMQPILYETYQGVFISIQYDIRACLRRSLFYRDLIDSVEFYVEYDLDPIGAMELKPKPVKFVITPYSLTAIRYDIIPNFKIVGQLDSSINLLNEPIRGHFVIENCDAVIRSVELQLVRVETCARNDNIDDSETVDSRNHCRDATEVQNIQIGDGNLLRKIPIDIYMVLPRLFTCPTLITKNFKVEFELNLVIIFDDNHLLTENFPIKLIRSTLQPIDFEG